MLKIFFSGVITFFFATLLFAQPPTQDEVEEQALQTEVSAIFDKENERLEYTCLNPLDTVKFPVGSELLRCVVVENEVFTRFPSSCRDAMNVRHIRCTYDNISSLEGIQQFPNLESLIVIGLKSGGSELTTLAPIRNLVNLYRVEVPSAKITSAVFLTRLPKLEYLNLDRNNITDLRYFRLMKTLRVLKIRRQTPSITDISIFSKLNSLRSVYLDSNAISDISPIATNSAIEELSFRDNRVTSLESLRGLQYLYSIDFTLNLIRDISPLAENKNLLGVYGVFNRITDLSPLRNLDNIIKADFRQNFVSSVEPFRSMKKIQAIMLDYNLIKSLEPIYQLRKDSKITELGFAYNCIPNSEFEKIWYRDEIQIKRYNHQCEIPHQDNETFDLTNIVNRDIVDYKNAANFDEIFFNVNKAGGCSIGDGSALTFIIETMFLLIFIVRKKLLFRNYLKRF